MHVEVTWHRLTDGMWYMDQVPIWYLLLVWLIIGCGSDVCDWGSCGGLQFEMDPGSDWVGPSCNSR